jgi:ankyrin repeat protein
MARKSSHQISHTGLDRTRRSELHYAVCDRNFERVKELIRLGSDVNLPDRNGWTPLHFAAQNYDERMARLLLDSGASVDPRDINGNTPLSTAVFNSHGRPELIELLRERGADATSINNFGVSPLRLARTIANYDVAQFFRDLCD